MRTDTADRAHPAAHRLAKNLTKMIGVFAVVAIPDFGSLRMRAGYDHSYYFVASFIGEHIAWHAAALDR